jgi:hypothetical protein
MYRVERRYGTKKSIKKITLHTNKYVSNMVSKTRVFKWLQSITCAHGRR